MQNFVMGWERGGERGGYGWGAGGVDGVKDAVVGWTGGGGMHGMM